MAAKKQKRIASRVGTFEDMLQAALVAKERYQEYEEAMAYCLETPCRGHTACSTQRWPHITPKGVNDRLDRVVVNGMEYSDRRILTVKEEQELADWVDRCNRAGEPQDRDQQRVQIRQILRVRRAANRRGGRQCHPLSRSAVDILRFPDRNLPDDQWFRRFYAAHPHVKEKKRQKCEKERAKAHSEETITDHFYGTAGLEQELIAAGMMDPTTRVIIAGMEKRLINRDETPQFFDYADSKGGGQRKYGAGAKDPAVQPSAENRADASIDVMWGLDGFQWGSHLVLARDTITDDLLPDNSKVFTDRIIEEMRVSTYGLISLTDCGVQTGATLVGRTKMFVEEMDARGGFEPLESGCRCIMLGDNHSSRDDEEYLEYCEKNGIWNLTEPSKSSGFLQALDQYNRQFHIVYNQGKKEYRKQFGESEAIDYGAFMWIFNRIWLSWSTPMDRIVSFRKVGITQSMLRPELVDRSKIHLMADDNAKEGLSPIRPKYLEVNLPTPPLLDGSTRKNTAIYWKTKYQQEHEARLEVLRNPFTPTECGVMTIPEHKKSRKRVAHRSENKHGSFNEVEAALELAKANKKLAMSEKKELLALEHQKLVDAWELCVGGNACQCDNDGECPMAKYKKCPTCGDIKARLCTKAACKAARASNSEMLAIEN